LTGYPKRELDPFPMKRIHLRTIRERLGMTQETLAAKSKVAQNTISKLEVGTTLNPESAVLLALSKALDVDPRELRFGPDPRKRRGARAKPRATAA
jgi:transcriptional regulator with XRE-family HTH domain